MKVKLVVENEGRVAEWEIGHSHLSGMIGYDFPIPPPEHPLVDLLSRHPSSAVRKQVAETFELPNDVIRRLESDPILAVQEGLVNGHSRTKEMLSPDFLSRIVYASIDAAERIASSMSDFEEAESADLIKALLGHQDPAVRKCHRRLKNDPPSPK